MDLPLRIAAPSASHFKQNASSPTAVQHCLATAFVKSSSKLEGKKKIFLHCFCPTPDMSTQILFLCSERSCSGPQHSAMLLSQQPGAGQAACHASPGKEIQGIPAGQIIILITKLPLLSLPSLPVLIIIRQLHIKNAICN